MRALPALAAGLALVLTGCAGSDDEPGGTGGPDAGGGASSAGSDAGSGSGGDVELVAGVQVRADAAALSADGRRLAAPCEDHLCVWDTRTGRLADELDGGSVLAWSPDGTELATSDGADVVELDARTGQVVARYTGHREVTGQDVTTPAIWDLAYSPDGTQLASAGYDGTVRVWDRGSDQATVLRPTGGWPTELAYSPDGDRLAVATTDGPPQVYDGSRSAPVATLGRDPVVAVAWSPAGDRVATVARSDGEIRTWDASSYRPEDELVVAGAGVSFSPDGARLAVPSLKLPTITLSTRGDPKLTILDGAAEPVGSALWAPDGTTLYTVGETEGVRRWDVASGVPSEPFELPEESTVPE